MESCNSTEQSSPPEYRDLHAEFRTILKLTELVSAINNSGHPTLRLPRQAYTSTPLLDVLFAIATLLVRDHEVVALGISGQNIVAVHQQTIASTPVLSNKDEDFMELPFDEDLDCSNIRVNKIAAVVNPREGDNYDIPDGDYCIVVDAGKSLLVANMPTGEEGWRYLDKLRNASLVDHISTLHEYLRLHQWADTASSRKQHENKFVKYLLAQCWPKLLRRIADWSSQGYISLLGGVDENELVEKVLSSNEVPKKFRSRNRNNNEFGALVIWMVDNGLMESVIMKRCRKEGWSSKQLTSLVESFRAVPGGTYDATTCLAFHRLLLATLLAYGFSLFAFANNDGEDVAPKYEQLFLCAGLLRQIASSLMLRQHLSACGSIVWALPSPTNNSDMLQKFRNYTQFPKCSCNDHMDPDPDDQLTEDPRAPADEVYLGWIRLQTSHLLALGTVSRAFSKPNTVVPTFSLLVANHPPPPQTMEPWTAVIHRVFKQYLSHLNAFDAESVERVIRAYTEPPEKPRPQNRHPVYRDFYSIHSDQPITFGNPTMHCEALLTSLRHRAETHPPEDHSEAIHLLQNLNPHDIAVSKECCPVCSELLSALGHHNIRGSHPTVFAVGLPPWLPATVMKEMIGRFESFLATEIKNMMLLRVGRRRRPSEQSQAGLSTGSHENDVQLKDIDYYGDQPTFRQ